MIIRKSKFGDGFHAYLTKDALLVGEPGIPMMMDLHNTKLGVFQKRLNPLDTLAI